jgi:hypothetical protein
MSCPEPDEADLIAESERLHRENDPHPFDPDELDEDEWADLDDWEDENYGTCARCGDWIYEPGCDLCSVCDLGYEPGED